MARKRPKLGKPGHLQIVATWKDPFFPPEMKGIRLVTTAEFIRSMDDAHAIDPCGHPEQACLIDWPCECRCIRCQETRKNDPR